MMVPPDFDDYLSSVPWDQLEDGYGPSSKTSQFGTKPLPTLLRELCSDSDDVVEDAVWGGIWGRACHQWSLYTASPYAGKALFILLRSADIIDRPIDREFLVAGEILKFLIHCVDVALKRPTDFDWPILLDAMREDTSVMESFRSHPDPIVRSHADNLSNLISRSRAF
jgi:hypothetical protein